jgi:UDP-2,3-diacylglucosamine pyrophosphatase LpxH
VPADVDTYKGGTQSDFVKQIAETNKGVIDAFNTIIQEGIILITYVPGNHDLTISEENVELILPGINQARDEVLGLGTYSPNAYPEIAIEHGHRYNFFCAPDPLSNQDIAPGSILPPGYFFTRIAVQHVVEDLPIAEGVVVPITPNATGNESQSSLYRYWNIWAWAANYFTINENFDEKIIATNIDGYTENYSINDLLPYQTTTGGVIDVNLYKGIQDSWTERQVLNHVEVNISTEHAITTVLDAAETDNQAQTQYFLNPNSNKRIVVFGHSHAPIIITSENHKGEKSIYANSGTWIDHNPRGATSTFVVITPQNNEPSSETSVKLYNFQDEVIIEMATDSLKL